MTESQNEIDRAYGQGKRAYRIDFGGHGPTLRERKFIVQANPYASGTVLFKAWERGYAQDTRRIVSGMVCNGT